MLPTDNESVQGPEFVAMLLGAGVGAGLSSGHSLQTLANYLGVI